MAARDGDRLGEKRWRAAGSAASGPATAGSAAAGPSIARSMATGPCNGRRQTVEASSSARAAAGAAANGERLGERRRADPPSLGM